MAREIGQIPALAGQLVGRRREIAAIAGRIGAARPRFAILCGRGSSGHAGVYLHYLVETRLGMVAAHASPSVWSAYRCRPAMDCALFVVISQSGRSPDLVAATEAARAGGALTLAIVNDRASPAAAASELVLPIGAGDEQAVAATKTVVLSMIAGALVVAAAAADRALGAALDRLPGRLEAALCCDWSRWEESLVQAPAAFVAGRGHALGPVREIALKMAETLRLPALGYSAAELRHGPRAAITPATPVLVLRQDDAAAPGVDALVQALGESGETVFAAGGPAGTLPWPGDDHPACDPVAMLVPAYRAIERAARRRGLDPDRPPHLSKVTETL